MKISSILIMALAAGALGAQDAPNLDGRIQIFAEISRPTQITLVAPDLKDQPRRSTGFGVRFLGELSSAPDWYYELGGMFDADSYFNFNGSVSGQPLDMTNVKFITSYWSLGAAYMGKVGESFTWGVHLEARGEYLRLQGEAIKNGQAFPQDQSTTYLRPWLRGSFDYTFMHIGETRHPYVGVEGSYAILKTYQTADASDLSNFDNRNLKALAPRASAAIYAGLRF